MISQLSIEKIKELTVLQVAEKYVPGLKKKGASYSAISPWNSQEKTGSFHVSAAKNIAKCFSSGNGANSGIGLLMKLKNIEWLEAVKILANDFNIQLEYEDNAAAQEYQKKQEKRMALSEVAKVALEFFTNKKNTAAVSNWRCKPTTAKEFALGFAPDSFNEFLNHTQELGIDQQQLCELGVLKVSENGKVYDAFRNRIIFPIFSHTNELVGFSGRTLDNEVKPKYLNSPESSLYEKKNNLLGIHLAKKHIIKRGLAYLVEGNYDVTSLHENGIKNAVAPCGTAVTLEQLKLLKRWAKTLVFFFDPDKAGIASMLKNIDVALELGLMVECVILEDEKLDADTWAKQAAKNEGDVLEQLQALHQDAVLFKSQFLFQGANTHASKIQKQQQVEEFLSLIEDSKIRQYYITLVGKKLKLGLTDFKKSVNQLVADREEEHAALGMVKLPEGASMEEFDKYGFFTLNDNKRIGYHFPTKGRGTFRATNFTIKPIMHIKSITDNKRLVELKNHRKVELIDVPTKEFIKPDTMNNVVAGLGNFLVYCDKRQYLQILTKLNDQFPIATEPKTLGWQTQGFYAYSNGIFTGKEFIPVSQNGLVEFEKEKYFLPAFSNIYLNVDSDDDLYENDRKFKFIEGELTFEAWADLFVKSYSNNGKIALAWVIAALFRDIVYREGNNFPHLFLYGEKGSGKSTLGWSLNDLQYNGMPAFNLNSGTQVGMYRRLGRVRNSLQLFEEFSNNLEIKRFQTLKAAYDGVGYEKGVMSRDNRTEMTKVNSSAVIVGQYLPTLDDNALFERSLLLNFKKLRDGETRPQEQLDAFNALMDAQKRGLGKVVLEILKYRLDFQKEFLLEYRAEMKELKDQLPEGGWTERIVSNFCKILVPVKILGNKLKIPFTYKELWDQAKEMIIEQTANINQSDALAQFWDMLEHLLDTKQITRDFQFKIASVVSEKYMKSRDIKADPKHYGEPTELLYLRFKNIVPLYQENARKQNISHILNKTDLTNYFKNHPAFEGVVSSTPFKDATTSALVFNYNKLSSKFGLDLERTAPPAPSAKEQQQEQQKSEEETGDDLPY